MKKLFILFLLFLCACTSKSTNIWKHTGYEDIKKQDIQRVEIFHNQNEQIFESEEEIEKVMEALNKIEVTQEEEVQNDPYIVILYSENQTYSVCIDAKAIEHKDINGKIKSKRIVNTDSFLEVVGN